MREQRQKGLAAAVSAEFLP